MRLICPRCGAQYEIDEAAIPVTGRDVECSACDHVWRATRAGAHAAAQIETAPVAADHDAAPASFDPGARPPLSRKLDDSVLEILREEAARELDARAAERNAQRATQRTADALARIGASRPPRGDGFEAGRDDDNTLPADADGPEGNGDAQGPAPSFGAEAKDEPAPAAVIPPKDGLGNATAAPSVAAVPGQRGHEPSPPAAATALPPAQGHPTATLDPRLHLPAAAQAPRPTAAQRARRRHDAGFHLALMVALIAVALYALAPRLADQGRAGEALMRWHHQVNDARDWLSGYADWLIAPR